MATVTNLQRGSAPDAAQFAQQVAAWVNDTSQEGRGSTANVFQGPDPVQVANADAALSQTALWADAHGNPIVAGFRLATQGTTEYLLVLFAPQDVYRSDSNFGKILDSFEPVLPPVFGLSPEEAVIAILPSRLSAQDAPLGYTVGPISSLDTPVTLAAGSSSPLYAFMQWETAGLVVRFRQPLTLTERPAAIPDIRSTLSLDANLFTDASAAHGYGTGNTLPPADRANYRFERVSLGAALGDAGAAWHVTWTPSGQAVQGYYEVRWQRGQLVFALSTAPQPLGQEQQADAKSLASALEATERTRPGLNIGPAGVTPPATESQRLLAALQLESLFVSAGAAPAGYSLVDSVVLHPASLVGIRPDPAAALQAVDEQEKVVVLALQGFESARDSRSTVTAAATLYADPQGAMAGIADAVPGPDSTSTRIDSPVQLGDTTLAVRDSGPNAAGDAYEGLSIAWTHGALVLRVLTNGPAGSISMDEVVALAQQLEARFQAAPFPTSGLGGA